MKRLHSCLLVLAAALGLSGASHIAYAAQSAAKPADPRAMIAKKFPGMKLEDVRPSAIPGMYEVSIGADAAYVSADGKYVIAGDMYEIDSRINVTEQGRSVARTKLLAKLDERDMIIFKGATPVKHTITVFTDVECQYCRKLHSQIDQLNKLGVQVRYVAYPRAGPETDDWRKMEAVWCAKDRKSAITEAKLGHAVKAPSCGATPVGKQYALGEDMGVRGTPAIFTNQGDYIGGYLPPQEMVRQLDALKAAHAAENRTAALN